MIDAINRLSDTGFVLFVLAVLATLVQLALLVNLAKNGGRVGTGWGVLAVALWIALWFVTR